MEELLKDKRFVHIAKDPKFRRIPKNERKVKIDKRFHSMFKDKRFKIKYSIDKRGRPLNQTSTENLKKFYELSSSEEDSSDENVEQYNLKNCKLEPKNDSGKKIKENEKVKKKKRKKGDNCDSESDNRNNCFLSFQNNDSSDEGTKNVFRKKEQDLRKKKSHLSFGNNTVNESIREKLKDMTVDYARGEGILISDSSSDEENSESDDYKEEIQHSWGELHKEAETTEESTYRLAVCNMDWDRIRAIDLMVLFNSFLPTGGLVHSVTIYPSDYGLQRIEEEELKGPIELVDSKTDKNLNDDSINTGDENEEGSSYHMEKLRQYQLNRLKYFYAVVVFDSVETAEKIYSECDGLEYESSATKIDLRFIPDKMTFEQQPKEVCNKLPEMTKYQPRLFSNSALQQVKVDCTWDETNPERKEIAHKLNSGKLNEVNKCDLQAYLASSTSGDESEDEMKKQLINVDEPNDDENPVDKYKSLLKLIEQTEEEKNNKAIELEFTWGLGIKEKTEKLVKENMSLNKNLTPFEKYLEKRKAKKIARKEQKKKQVNNSETFSKSDSEDSIPSDFNMNDPYFAEELKNTKPIKINKRKKTIDNDLYNDQEEEKRKQGELELLLMDDQEESDKHHFSMKRIEEAEALTKSKKKRMIKKKMNTKKEEIKDNFEVNVKDVRFKALYTSHNFNIDPADPHYRKTKGTEALIQEKLEWRHQMDNDYAMQSTNNKKPLESSNENRELNTLIESIKRNTKNIKNV